MADNLQRKTSGHAVQAQRTHPSAQNCPPSDFRFPNSATAVTSFSGEMQEVYRYRSIFDDQQNRFLIPLNSRRGSCRFELLIRLVNNLLGRSSGQTDFPGFPFPPGFPWFSGQRVSYRYVDFVYGVNFLRGFFLLAPLRTH